MGERELNRLFEGGGFFEGPRWHEGRWWASDFYRHGVFTYDPSGGEELILTVENQPSGLGWLPDGSLLIVSMRDHVLLRRDAETGEVEEVADLSEHCSGHLNDMVVDSEGRAWVGDFGFDLMSGADPAATNLLRVDPDGTVTVVASDVAFPNGAVITPDGTTLIVGETIGCCYTAWTIASDGSLTDRRTWAELAPRPALGPFATMLPEVRVAPDGCCLDAEGHIWSADAIGNRCIRIAPGGEIVDQIDAPEGLGIFACMLGGDDGRTLLLCAAPDYFEHLRSSAREAVLLTTTVDVPHAGLP
ncbi:MAG TPA: SMP-30/gluconolactonase/LRE family protein [Acidimicrobiales bacterium]|jgi:sugar lactone lactonase YvrE